VPAATASSRLPRSTSTDIVMSTWVIDQPTNDNWVEVFSRPTVIQ